MRYESYTLTVPAPDEDLGFGDGIGADQSIRDLLYATVEVQGADQFTGNLVIEVLVGINYAPALTITGGSTPAVIRPLAVNNVPIAARGLRVNSSGINVTGAGEIQVAVAGFNVRS